MAKRRTSTISRRLSDKPWWLEAGVKFGAPTILAGYLVWVFVSQFTANQRQLTASFEQHQRDTADLVRHLQQESEQGWIVIGVLSRTCINTSRNDADRVACVSVARRPQ